MYFVPSGKVVSFPSLSVTFGVTVVSSPAFPVAGSYFTAYLSASFSAGVVFVAVAVIVAFSAVISVPAGVDHTGFSYPSFAFASGYLSAGNFVPSFTS